MCIRIYYFSAESLLMDVQIVFRFFPIVNNAAVPIFILCTLNSVR